MPKPPQSVPTQACLTSLMRTEALISNELARHLRDRGTSPAAFRLLATVAQSELPVCPHEIGERLSITRGAVSQLLDSLEEQGLVRRVPHAEDRRMLVVELTERARQLLDGLLPDYLAAERRVLDVLDESERAALHRLLAKIQEGVAARQSARA